MGEWVSISDAARLLTALGDKVSRPGVSQYLNTHEEVGRRDQGPGQPLLVDFEALKLSRATRRGRGVAQLVAPPPAPAGQLPLSPPGPPTQPAVAATPAEQAPRREPSPYADRKAAADTHRAESEARRASILADEAEGRVIPKDRAVAAFTGAAVALAKALEENRRGLIDEVRAARDVRAADAAVRGYEKRLRMSLSQALADMAASATPELAAAQ